MGEIEAHCASAQVFLIDDAALAAARMALLGGAQVYPTRSHFQHAWDTGRISQQDLHAALAQLAPAQRAGAQPDRRNRRCTLSSQISVASCGQETGPDVGHPTPGTVQEGVVPSVTATGSAGDRPGSPTRRGVMPIPRGSAASGQDFSREGLKTLAGEATEVYGRVGRIPPPWSDEHISPNPRDCPGRRDGGRLLG